jgi:hypothetical protein
MIAILKGRYDYRNCKRCYYQNLGQGKNIIGKSLLSIMPEIIEQGFAEILADVYKTGIHAYETPVGLVHDGKLKYCITLLFIKQRNINGEIEGVAVIANDNTSACKHQFKKKAKNVSGPYLIMCLYFHY